MSLAQSPQAKELQTLSTNGISLSEYAALFTIFWMTVAAIWCGVGFVIFWRRSDDWLALFAAFFLIMFGITASANSIMPQENQTKIYWLVRSKLEHAEKEKEAVCFAPNVEIRLSLSTLHMGAFDNQSGPLLTVGGEFAPAGRTDRRDLLAGSHSGTYQIPDSPTRQRQNVVVDSKKAQALDEGRRRLKDTSIA